MKYFSLRLNWTLLATVFGGVICQGQGTFYFHVTFDGPPFQPPGSAAIVQTYSETGMSFTSVVPGGTGFVRVGRDPRAERPENGTAYLQAGLGSTLMFSFLYAPTFNLVSVDLAEYSTVVPDAVTVHFIGYRLDGSTVTTDFMTDGIIDGTGPLADFQTFYFGPEFSGLTRVEIPTSGWSLDNLVFTVPEPSAGTLLFLGGLALLARRPRTG
jgi:hypothetical protein